jgi:hypothetical protein
MNELAIQLINEAYEKKLRFLITDQHIINVKS